MAKFELFDPRADYVTTKGSLPHWYQPGVTYFVTFRTDDSVPRALVAQWTRRRDAWLRSQGIDPGKGNLQALLALLTKEQRHEFSSRFTAEFMNYLDLGLGACVLRRPAIAEIVAEGLRHFAGDRYHLGDFVIMPNHVHLLCCLLSEIDIEQQCTSWKQYSATRINRALGQKGRFWQTESFDHLVRSADQFDYLRNYIATNPQKAGLSPGEFLHECRPTK